MRGKALDVQFKWVKPEANPHFKTTWKAERRQGFVWRVGNGATQLRWTSEERGGVTLPYQPPPGLFRIFVGLNGRVEILEFANAFGDILAVPGSQLTRDDDKGKRIVRFYAGLTLWEQEIQRLRRIVGLWDDSNKGTPKARLDARTKLHEGIGKVIQDRERLCYTIVCLSPRGELIARPVTLLAHMWLTLARLAAREIEERPCDMFANCGNYIYIGHGPGLQRSDTSTCNDRCRQKKKRQAAKLN